MKSRRLVWLLSVLSFVTGVAFAHHSQTMFDETKMVTVKGTISQFKWINPHVQIYVDVKEKGQTKTWQIEANSAVSMKRAGWARDQFKQGEPVEVSFHPTRSGSPQGYLRKIIGPDGKPLEMGGNTPQAQTPPQTSPKQ